MVHNEHALEKKSSSIVNAGKERDYVIENLALLMASNMDIISVLTAISAEIKSKKLQIILNKVKDDISGGTPIWRALEESHLLPGHIVTLIKIGEQTGRLPENLNIVVSQQKKEQALKSKIVSALIYPAIVLSLTLVVGIGISWFILPKLARVFRQLKLQLPLITKIFIGFGSILSQYGIILVPLFFAVLIGIIYLLFFHPKTKHIGHALLFSIPAIRSIIQQVEVARFGFIFGTLLKAGLPIIDALDSVKESTGFEQYRDFYEYLQSSIDEGNSFKNSFAAYPKINKLMPPSVQQLITSSERSGKLADTLIQIGETYEAKTETSTKNLSVLIEPILLVIIWLGVVCLAVAVILPIYSLIGGFNTTPTSSSQYANAPEPTEVPIKKEATVSATIATPSATLHKPLGKIEILPTDNGTVNMREEASTKSTIVAKVKSGEEYDYFALENNWYQIQNPDGKTGWITGQYAKKILNSNTEVPKK